MNPTFVRCSPRCNSYLAPVLEWLAHRGGYSHIRPYELDSFLETSRRLRLRHRRRHDDRDDGHRRRHRRRRHRRRRHRRRHLE